MVRLKAERKYLRSGTRYNKESLWTENERSAKVYSKLGNARLAVTNAVQCYKVKYEDVVIEQYEAMLVATLGGRKEDVA